MNGRLAQSKGGKDKLMNDRQWEKYLRTYSDKMYMHTTMVRHHGTMIAFAMDQHRRIYYAVLDLENQNQLAIDAKNWPKNPIPLAFPSEVAQVGFGVTDQVALPAGQTQWRRSRQRTGTTS